MIQKTMLALALFLAVPLMGLAAPSDELAPASCTALPTTQAPQVGSEPQIFLASVEICSPACSVPSCRGQEAFSPCSAGPGKAGYCRLATTYCSADGLHSCSCWWLDG